MLTETLLLIAALLGLTAAMAVVAPLLLTRGSWRFARPGLALALWHVALHGGLAAAAGSFVVAMGLATSLVGASVGPASSWWTSVEGVVLAWVGLTVAGGSAVLIGAHSRRLSRADSRTRHQLAALVAELGIHRAEADGMTITVIESDRALACALPGPAPALPTASERSLHPATRPSTRLSTAAAPRHRVVVSSALARALGPAELRAVMQHELAHLRLHHPLLVRLARLNVACLPLLPGARELDRVTGTLVELIADDAAARRCGPQVLAAALTRVGALEDDPALLLRAERLRRRTAGRPRLRRPTSVPALSGAVAPRA